MLPQAPDAMPYTPLPFVIALAALCAAHARAQQPAPAGSEGAGPGQLGRFELKRQNTARGTPDESTMTTLRAERFFDGPVAMVRLDVPLPDEKTDFGGSLFQPRLGDLKTRVRFRSLKSGERSFQAFVELIYPTADPKSLGKGKYQVSEGLRMIAPVRPPFLDASTHQTTFEAEVQQTNAVAGDPAAKDVNNTRFEFTVYDVWERLYTVKLKLKPNIDWAQDGKTGGVAEGEVGRYFEGGWRGWIMAGHRVWGPSGIANTYKARVELGFAYTY